MTQTSSQPALTATRNTVLDLLKRGGPQSAADLADTLGLTPMAVRLHLYELAEEGLVPLPPYIKRKAEEGDWVIITRYAGSRVKIDGGELRIVNEDEILAVVDDPRDILPANIL